MVFMGCIMACERSFSPAVWSDAMKRLLKDELVMTNITHSYLTVRREVRSHPLRAARGTLVWHRYVQGWSELERQRTVVSLGLTLKHSPILDGGAHKSEAPAGVEIRTLAPAKEEGKPFRFDQP